MADPVRVLIVDDSSVVRQALKNNLGEIPGIVVVGVAPDPYVARDMIMAHKPDVITLDIEMPRMDGLTFLRKLMKFHPVRTIVVSSLTQSGCDTALACLESGAMGVVAKPAVAYSIGDMAAELGRMIKDAARHPVPEKRPDLNTTSGEKLIAPPSLASLETTHKIVAIGTSTGGTEALRHVLSVLPKQAPGIVMTQHMPEGFTASFAARLNEQCEIEVREAKDGDSVVTGLALLAPGNKHTRLARDGARYIVRVSDGPRVCRHKPSVEVLFDSTAEHAGRNAMGIIMTGMGNDGAQGLKTMRDAGAYTVAQDKDSCVVFGMPREAIEKGGAITVCPLSEIAGQIMDFAAGNVDAKAA